MITPAVRNECPSCVTVPWQALLCWAVPYRAVPGRAVPCRAGSRALWSGVAGEEDGGGGRRRVAERRQRRGAKMWKSPRVSKLICATSLPYLLINNINKKKIENGKKIISIRGTVRWHYLMPRRDTETLAAKSVHVISWDKRCRARHTNAPAGMWMSVRMPACICT